MTSLLANPAPAKSPARVRLQGKHVAVVPLDPLLHGEALFLHTCGADKEHLWRYLHEGPFDTREAFDDYLRRKTAAFDPQLYAIVDTGSGLALGLAAYMRITPEHRVIEVGNILFSRRLQKTAAATEAMYLMARHAFEGLGYRRYEWKCDSVNEPSRQAALRLGFQFEGIFRQHMIVKGRNRDTAWYSMLDTEWPLCKAVFETWLAPVNFDEAGRQKLSLSAVRAAI